MTYNVLMGTLNPTHSLTHTPPTLTLTLADYPCYIIGSSVTFVPAFRRIL